MDHLSRITSDPAVMGGHACIRDLGICVSTLIGLLSEGASPGELIDLFPGLDNDDIREAMEFASWRSRSCEEVAGSR